MVLQVIANIAVAWSIVAMVASGFALIYNCAKFFHFTQVLTFAAGPYCALATIQWLHLPWQVAIAAGLIACATLGCAIDLLVYRPLRQHGASPLVLLLASLGLYMVGQNGISIIFGDQTRRLVNWRVSEGLSVFGSRMTVSQLGCVVVGAVVLGSLLIGMKLTRLGQVFRAIGDDPELAIARCVRRNALLLLAFVSGSVNLK